jgi:tRNA threonylcarbamoyladenosine biosynthesis protein TsaB
MKVLALELSSPIGSVASVDDQSERQFRSFPADRKNSGIFFESLQAIFQSNAPPDLIVVGLGPGSYAGVRIAIATALGLRSATKSQLRGFPSISAIDRKEYFFVSDARRNSFAFAHVFDGRCLEGPLLCDEEEIRKRLAAANGRPIISTQPLPQFPGIAVEHPSALRLLELSMKANSATEETLEPIYLRAPYFTTSK